MKRSLGAYLIVGLFQVSSWKQDQTINAIIEDNKIKKFGHSQQPKLTAITTTSCGAGFRRGLKTCQRENRDKDTPPVHEK
jgi:hypothetical protein